MTQSSNAMYMLCSSHLCLHIFAVGQHSYKGWWRQHCPGSHIHAGALGMLVEAGNQLLTFAASELSPILLLIQTASSCTQENFTCHTPGNSPWCPGSAALLKQLRLTVRSMAEHILGTTEGPHSYAGHRPGTWCRQKAQAWGHPAAWTLQAYSPCSNNDCC